jgi:hypothetical protein
MIKQLYTIWSSGDTYSPYLIKLSPTTRTFHTCDDLNIAYCTRLNLSTTDSYVNNCFIPDCCRQHRSRGQHRAREANFIISLECFCLLIVTLGSGWRRANTPRHWLVEWKTKFTSRTKISFISGSISLCDHGTWNTTLNKYLLACYRLTQWYIECDQDRHKKRKIVPVSWLNFWNASLLAELKFGNCRLRHNNR